MPGIDARCRRQESPSVRKPSMRACMIGLALAQHPHHVHSHKSPRRTNELNVNNYCGKDWAEAFSTCWLPCPDGTDVACLEGLGAEYTCQKFTLCSERIAKGEIFPEDPNAAAGMTDAPTKQPTLFPTTLQMVDFPACPDDYSTGNAYSLGNLVAYLDLGSSSELVTSDTVMKGVYECQGDNCNSGEGYAPGSENGKWTWTMVGSCNHSTDPSVEESTDVEVEGTATPTAAPPTPMWFPKSVTDTIECAYGTDFPAAWLVNEALMEQFLFESEADCCTANPQVACISTNRTESVVTMPPETPGAGTPGAMNTGPPATGEMNDSEPTIVPTAAPTEGVSVADTFESSSALSFVRGQKRVSFSITTAVLIVLFF